MTISSGNNYSRHLCKLLVVPAIVLTMLLSANFNVRLNFAGVYTMILPAEMDVWTRLVLILLTDTVLISVLIWSVIKIYAYHKKIIYIYYFWILVVLHFLMAEMFASILVSVFNVNMHDNEEGLDAALDILVFCFFCLMIISSIMDWYFKRPVRIKSEADQIINTIVLSISFGILLQTSSTLFMTLYL